MKTCIAKTLAIVILLTLTSHPCSAQEVFSIDGGSGAPFAAGDLISPGPLLSIKDSSLAAGGALTGVEIDGISDGLDLGTELLFSVDKQSSGVAGTDVFKEFAGGSMGAADHTTDIYRNSLFSPGTNKIFRDGNGIANPLSAPGPALGLSEPFDAAMDNTDAYNIGLLSSIYDGPVYFTVGADATGGFDTDSVLFVDSPDGTVATYASGLTLSLRPTDDIDAIFVFDDGDSVFSGNDIIGFSLDRGANSLSAGSDLSDLYAAGAELSPADVFILTGSGSAFYVPAASHGLLFTDNIDALDQTFVPEPSASLVLLFSAAICIGRFRNRKAKPKCQ